MKAVEERGVDACEREGEEKGREIEREGRREILCVLRDCHMN